MYMHGAIDEHHSFQSTCNVQSVFNFLNRNLLELEIKFSNDI
jgi:hypothetical protein